MSRREASHLAHDLGLHAEAVCRHYLSNGRRCGNYWQVGDVRNTPGRSMFVRLHESAKARAGRWQDLATSEHGDLLDIIRVSCGLHDFRDVLDEAERFLNLPHAEPVPATIKGGEAAIRSNASEAARRLFAMSHPISGTLAQTYLHHRGIRVLQNTAVLRFHPRCYYRSNDNDARESWPAMIAAVTDLHGKIVGAHRTWLACDGTGKAPVDTPRKAMGELLGHAVRFGGFGDVMAAGEGIETVLSLREVLPPMAMLAALSGSHLGAILFPAALRRLYIVRDNDAAGDAARDMLVDRALGAGIEAVALSPTLGDFNEDLRAFGREALCSRIRGQLAQEDIARFIVAAT